MATYRLSATVVERNGDYHVRVVATSEARGAGVIFRQHDCYSKESAEMSLEVLIDQVHAAIEAIGGDIDCPPEASRK